MGRIERLWGVYDTKEEVMDWMITYQDVRRNMCDAEKIYANDKVSARRIEEENEKKKLEGSKLGGNIKNGNVPCVQMDANHSLNERDRSTNSREQRAKLAGVGTGTIARFNRVTLLNPIYVKGFWEIPILLN